MNLTPTCVCDQGFVAVAEPAQGGASKLRCVAPMQQVPGSFYASTLPALPPALPGGREVILTVPMAMPTAGADPEPTPVGFPMPRSNPDLGPSQIPVAQQRSDGGCSLGNGGAPTWAWLVALGAAASLRRRRN
jgi:MYXO-CTERM domain-containing protein